MSTPDSVLNIAAIASSIFLSGKFSHYMTYCSCPDHTHYLLSIQLCQLQFAFSNAVEADHLLKGKIAAQGLVTVPALLRSIAEDATPARVIITIWHRVYQSGHAHSPKIAGLSSTAFAYLAWKAQCRHAWTDPPVLLYGAAALSVVGIVPYTLAFMEPTNNALLERARDVEASPSKNLADNHYVMELLARWKFLTLGRSLFPMMAGVFGAWALMQYT